jgi:hypothetical protein
LRGCDVNFTPTEEREDLQNVVRRYQRDKSPEAEIRRRLGKADGYD